jgi:hypothetical protein
MPHLARFLLRMLMGIMLAVVLASCAASREKDAPSRTVSLAEFLRGADAAEGTSAPAVEPTTSATPAPTRTNDAIEIVAAPDEALSAGPVFSETSASESDVAVIPLDPGEQVFVDRMVGQVNGRPIFANEFFAPIADQLRAESVRLEGQAQAFARSASDIIQNQLREVVLNDLFLAEAESNLTFEQQQGVFVWLRDVREQIVGREGGGSEAQARQKILADQDITLEEYIQQTRDQALIRQLLRDEVASRVVVSWRDVQREYERNAEQFNPPSIATLSRITLSTEARADDIAAVTARLAAGETFETVAADLGMPNDGQWDTFELADHTLGSIALSDRVKPHVVDLAPGEVSAPFEVGRSTWWVKVLSIDQPDARSIYDAEVQRQLRQHIQAQRFAEEQNRYIQSLFERGIYDELNEMNTRLLEMALLRYGSP